MRIASCSSSNGITVTTGPKISSCATVIELSTLARTVGRQNAPFPFPASPPAPPPPPPPVPGSPAGPGLRALLAAALDEAVHAVAMLRRDQRADLRLRIERIAEL